MGPSEQITILVVDDDERVRRAVEIILHHSGYQVVPTASGQEAIDLTSSIKPNLVLMDVMMPFMDGLETIRRIRELPEVGQVPVILLSVIGEEDEAKQKGEELGVCDSIAKPVKIEVLRARIEACLQT